MSTVNSVGITTSQLSSALAALTGNTPAGSDASPGSLSLTQLQRLLRQQLDQAFRQGTSLSDTGTSLANTVSSTLAQYGVSDEQSQTVVSGLQQIFAQAGSRSEARQNAQQFLDNFVQSLDPSTVTSPPTVSAASGSGQNFDASA
ncbi:MAG TPA: hypothetical protein VG125_21205 [Pirellulales bacterium]|jgi:hypothetical protein|nr:hypothetical protein [Pirellulales bacterium]